MWRRFTLLLLTATISAGLDPDRPALAQGGGDLEAERSGEPEPVPDARNGAVVFRVSDRQVDRWVFANDGDVDSARRLTESRLRSRIVYIDHLCGLSPDQSKKLEVAGRGDIKRFFDRVREKRNQIHLNAKQPAEVIEAINEMQRMGGNYKSTLFNDQSMFGKVLGMTLNPEQRARYRRNHDHNRLSRHQSRVEWVALTLQKNLSLSDGQRIRLLSLLLEETRPPQRFGPSDYYGIMYQASRLPETRLRPIFAEAEWRALLREFDDAKRQERVLKDFGYLPDEDDRPARDAPRGTRKLSATGGQAVL
jgi:hypothetical protein